jgi:poly(3-hydroxyalkanoate) synthetase
MATDNINRQFVDAFNVICTTYNAAGENDYVALNQCVRGARGLLTEPAIPT